MQFERHSLEIKRYDELTLAGWVARQAMSRPTAEATMIGRSPKARVYGVLWERAQRLAAGLARLGIGAGDRIALVTGGELEHADAMVACSLLGAVFVSLDTEASPIEAIAAGGCKAAIVADYALAPLLDAREHLGSLKWVIGLSTKEGKSTPAQLQAKGVRPYAEMLAADSSARAFAGSDADGVMELVFRAGDAVTVITQREYVESVIAACGGRQLSTTPQSIQDKEDEPQSRDDRTSRIDR